MIPEEFKRNRILSALGRAGGGEFLSGLESVRLSRGERLIGHGDPLKHVYFPLDSMISLVSLMSNGASVEAGVVGCEGVLGLPALLGAGATPMESVVQIPGGAARIDARGAKEAFEQSAALRDLVLRYAHAVFVEVSQSAACNRCHGIDTRLCRWMLMSADCVGSTELPLTHEFMAQMLGVRRAGVSVAAKKLREEGLIQYRRGRITILDRDGLERKSCECYGIVRREFARAFGGNGEAGAQAPES